VICQTTSLETFVRSAAIVMFWTRKVGIAVAKVCVSRIECSLAKRAVLGLASNGFDALFMPAGSGIKAFHEMMTPVGWSSLLIVLSEFVNPRNFQFQKGSCPQ